MGLGFQTRASLRRKKLFGFASVASPKEVADAILHCTTRTPLEPLAFSAELDTEGGYAFTLHPVSEPMYMELDGEYVTLSAKTSDAGPGYHAFLVSILDTLESSLGLKWEWSKDDEETTYVRDRDFAGLQSEMAKHFKALCRVIAGEVAGQENSGMMMSMPIDFGAEIFGNEVLTPLGPKTVDELRIWSGLEGDELRRVAATYFPWWGQGFNGDFYRGLALHSMWMEQRWATPIDESDRGSVKRTLGWCAQAERMAADPPVPPQAVSELVNLLTSPTHVFPKEGGIGYRRRMMRKRLTGHWTLNIPGSFEEGTEDEGTMIVFWNDVLTIRATAFTESSDKGEMARDDFEPGHVEAKRDFFPDSDGEGFLLQLDAKTRSSNGEEKLCLVTVWMPDIEQRRLAEQIADSLAYRE